MNKISLYVLLILAFLGLSKSFSPSEQRTPYLPNEQVFSGFFSGAPLSVILVDSFQTGFLIKTYFQKYRIIHAFKIPEEVVVRTSRELWERNLKNRGMSIFRRREITYDKRIERLGHKGLKSELSDRYEENSVPMPPGFLYIGDRAYGKWRLLDSGKRVWTFHRAYRHFPKLFRWGSYRPDINFYKKANILLEQNKPFYGQNDEFGAKGTITQEQFKETLNFDRQKIDFTQHLKTLIQVPPWEMKNE